MKVSVIIPVKNRARLLVTTLHSIFDQTLPPFEVLVVDDGSDDNLPEALEEFGNKITLLKNDGCGPGAGRNTGLRYATGDAIQFFDSDDLMSSNKFEIQVGLLRESGADFVYGPYAKAILIDDLWKRTDAIMQYKPVPLGSLRDLVLEGWCLTQTILFRAEFLKRIGFWNETLTAYEDYEYGFRIAKANPVMIHETKTFVLYREHPQQITSFTDGTIRKIDNQLAAYDLIKSQIDFKPSLHAKMLFWGSIGGAKQFRRKVSSEELPISIKESLGAFYHRFVTKIELMKTRSGWRQVYGAIDSEELFQEYLKLIRHKR